MIDLKIKKPVQMTTVRPYVYCQDYMPLQEKAVTMLYAGGGTGKSYASIKVAIIYFLETKKNVILWLTEDAEGENRVRFESLLLELPEEQRDDARENIHFVGSQPAKLTQYDGSNAVITKEYYEIRIMLAQYGLVVFDPLLQFNGCDENSNTHAGVMMGALKDWANEDGKVLLLLHHATKNKDDGFKPRGAGEWVNGCRAVYELGRDGKCERRELKFTLRKDNGVGRYFSNDSQGERSRILPVFPEYEYKPPITHRGHKFFISLANHNNAKDPSGFVKHEFDDFNGVHDFVLAGRGYSQYSFKDEYRKGENNNGGITLICLDFDDGMTLETAKRKFGNFECCIITTKSHQVEKSGKTCDRFRVILSLKTPLDIPLSDYPLFLDMLNELTGGEVDRSTKDLARFYFASPKDAKVWYSNSKERMEWNHIHDKVKQNRIKAELEKKIQGDARADASERRRAQNSSNREPRNTLSEDTLFETQRGAMFFSDLRNSLSVGEQVPCKCNAGIDHGDMGPHHMSAFIKKDDNGNVRYHCSGARCAGEGTLWCQGWDN